MSSLFTLDGPRPVTVLSTAAVCLVDGLPWPAHAPPLERLLQRWPRHIRAAAAAAVARVGAGAPPVRTDVDLAQNGGIAPTHAGWWVMTLAGEAAALWVDMIRDEGVLMPAWWYADEPGRTLVTGWPETRWDPRAHAVPLDTLRGALGVTARGLTGARAVLAALAQPGARALLRA